MTGIEFRGFGKIPRLFREVVVTEKIDGTNGAVGIDRISGYDLGMMETVCTPADAPEIRQARFVFVTEGEAYWVYAQSRNRIITPQSQFTSNNDNHGFARWVWDNAESLINDLGEGLHFGEWWGQGINRGYGMDGKRFSLFNTRRWEDARFKTPGVYAVPVIERGEFSTTLVRGALEMLRIGGSFAAPGFMQPEGVVVYHVAGNILFKTTLQDDAMPKQAVLQQVRQDVADVLRGRGTRREYGVAA